MSCSYRANYICSYSRAVWECCYIHSYVLPRKLATVFKYSMNCSRWQRGHLPPIAIILSPEFGFNNELALRQQMFSMVN